MREEYKYLLCEAKKVAVDSFEIFLNRLQVDSSLFEHLHDIKYSIGKTIDESAFAEYYQDTNEIVISEKRVNNGLNKVKKGIMTEDDLIENIAVSYLHEMLHANRTIIIANILNMRNYDEFFYKANYNNEHRDELLKYKYTLEEILKKHDIKKFTYIIPIIVKFNSNKTYTVVSYNLRDKQFEVYDNQLFQTKLNNINNFLYSISRELNENKKQHPINRIVYDYFDYDDVVALPCDYYRYYDNVQIDVNNVNQFKRFEKKIKSKVALEEIITEALAMIMIFTREQEVLDYDELSEYNFDENVIVGIDLIKSLDDETLKWYFLSTYDEVYYDRFSKVFKDNYNKLLKFMYKIYELERPISNEMKKEFEYILRTSSCKKK